MKSSGRSGAARVLPRWRWQALKWNDALTHGRAHHLTDVDAKTIQGAPEATVAGTDFTEQLKHEFLQGGEALVIEHANAFRAASDHDDVSSLITMTGVVIARGPAYQADDKSVM